MSATESRRAHGRSPWREAFEMLAKRPSAASESSCMISRNAKGHFQFEITVRGDDAGQCCEDAYTLTEQMSNRYPYPTANGGTE